jgi:hypothetical protein
MRTKRSNRHHIYTIGPNESPFYKGKPKFFYFLLLPLGQISLSPIVGDDQPNYFANLKRKTLVGTGKFFTIK